MRSIPARAALLATSLLVAGCVTPPGSDRIARKDPLERINRKVYKFDRGLDKAILRPVAVGYTKIVPQAGRRGIANGFSNLTEPETFVNAVLEAKPKLALRALARFVINSTLGVGGLADQASKMGLPQVRKDFGQTFATWGIGSGPYLVLPVLGPSTFRDAAGRGAEFAGGDPVEFGRGRLHLRWYVDYSITALRLISLRSQLLDTADPVLKGAADEYATVRSAYLQERRSQIYDGHPPDEDTGDDPAAPGGVAPPNPAGSPPTLTPGDLTQPPASTPPVSSPSASALPVNPSDNYKPVAEPPVVQPQ